MDIKEADEGRLRIRSMKLQIKFNVLIFKNPNDRFEMIS